MKLDEFVTRASDVITVRRVFGEPIVQDGMTVIPAASIWGGGGGGGGHDMQGQDGEGGGFGVHARPAGAYIIKDDEVRWVPSIDVNYVGSLAAAIALTYICGRARIARSRPRRRAPSIR